MARGSRTKSAENLTSVPTQVPEAPTATNTTPAAPNPGSDDSSSESEASEAGLEPPPPPPPQMKIPSNKKTNLTRQMREALYDGFKLRPKKTEKLSELYDDFNNFMRFLATVLNVFEFGEPTAENSPTGVKQLNQVAAETLAMAIMTKLEVKNNTDWINKKRAICEACRTEEDFLQMLWQVGLITPEAIMAKLYVMYHPELTTEDQRDFVSVEQYWEECRKMPLHQAMQSCLMPLVVLADWKSARILGAARIKQWMKDNPDDWWVIPPVPIDKDWLERVDQSTNHTLKERKLPTLSYTVEVEEIPVSSSHSQRERVEINTMGQRNNRVNPQEDSLPNPWKRKRNRNQGNHGQGNRGQGNRGQGNRGQENQGNRRNGGNQQQGLSDQSDESKNKRARKANDRCHNCDGIGHHKYECSSAPRTSGIPKGPKN